MPTPTAPLAATRRHCTLVVASLGLGLLAATAQAQSTVTIYGIIDQGVAKANGGSTPGTLLPGRGTNPNTWSMKAGNTSRLGFRGQEDLGEGRYARFQIEHRFASDTGASSNANVFWLGRSVVAIGSRDLGEVYLGREYSAAYWVALNADPTLWSYVSQLGSPYTYANYTPVATTIEASNIRWANSLGYKSPNLGGLTFEVATALGEGTRPRSTSANAQFRRGPLWLGAAMDRLDSRTHMELLAAGYDFGVINPLVSVSQAKGGLNGNGKAYSLGATMPTGFGRVLANFGSYRPATGLDSTMFATGAQLDLSKRTLLYANLGSAKRDGLTRTTAYDLGIKHTF